MKAKEALDIASRIREDSVIPQREFLLAAIAKSASEGALWYLHHGSCCPANQEYLRSLGYTVQQEGSNRYDISWEKKTHTGFGVYFGFWFYHYVLFYS